MQNKRAYVISIIWGAVAAIIISGCMPVLRLGELAGPPDFVTPICLIVFVVFMVACFTTRQKGFLQGAVWGALFAMPVTIACFLIAHSDEGFYREHGRELHSIGVVLFFIILIVAGMVGEIRAENDQGV